MMANILNKIYIHTALFYAYLKRSQLVQLQSVASSSASVTYPSFGLATHHLSRPLLILTGDRSTALAIEITMFTCLLGSANLS